MSKKQKIKALVDIVIPVHGQFELLSKCLDAIPEAFGDILYQIYIFDNGSPKEEANKFYVTLESYEDIAVIRNHQNLGFPRACNNGAKRGNSPLIFFLNSDVILQEGSGEKLVKEMDDPKTGIAGMKLIYPPHKDTEAAGLNVQIRSPGRLQHIGLVADVRAQVSHVFVGWDHTHPKVNKVHEIMAVTGAALMIKRNLFIKVKMFDEIYGQGTWEDVDLCMKIREIGYNIVVNPESVGIHYTGASAEKYKQGFPLNRNHQLFVQRWRDEKKQLEPWDWRIL